MENPGSYNSSDAYYPYDYYYYNYDYNYTYEESLNYLPLEELIPSLTFYVLIGLLGLAGNILVIVAILAFPRMKSITNVFLLSLASADLLLVLICVPIKVFFYLFIFSLHQVIQSTCNCSWCLFWNILHLTVIAEYSCVNHKLVKPQVYSYYLK